MVGRRPHLNISIEEGLQIVLQLFARLDPVGVGVNQQLYRTQRA